MIYELRWVWINHQCHLTLINIAADVMPESTI